MISSAIQRLSRRNRWWIYLIVINAPIFLILLHVGDKWRFHPENFSEVWYYSINKIIHWGGCFGFAFMISGVTASQLWIKRESIIKIAGISLLWAFMLRLALIPLGYSFVRLKIHVGSVASLSSTSYISGNQQIFQNPTFTIISYGFLALIIGFTEELWRASTLAGLAQLYPNMFKNCWKAVVMIVLVSVLFGLGHLDQGVIGIAISFVFGIGAGTILFFRKSYWEAAMAHSFFDGTTFLLLYLSANH